MYLTADVFCFLAKKIFLFKIMPQTYDVYCFLTGQKICVTVYHIFHNKVANFKLKFGRNYWSKIDKTSYSDSLGHVLFKSE